MPQGGVDQNESYLDAAYRELYEETNIKEIELIRPHNLIFSVDRIC
mgnify:CR=1 FL=1